MSDNGKATLTGLDQEVTVGDTTYTVRFTLSALTLAERWIGSTVPELAMKSGLALATRNFPFDLTVRLAAAGLEGARRKHQLGGQQWTVAKVEDLLDDAEDFVTVAQPVFEAFDAACLRWFPEWAEADEADEVDPQMAAGAGIGSTPPDSEQDSPTETSGD